MSSSELTYEVFLQPNGIFTETIDNFFDCEIFFLQHSSLHVKFFKDCMTDDASADFVQKCLFQLAEGYHNSYKLRVSATSGGLEKRIRNGKLMIAEFEADRHKIRAAAEKKFNGFSSIRSLFYNEANEVEGLDGYSDITLIFLYLEDFLYKNYWQWHHFSKGLHVDNFIKERPTDSSYPFSPTLLHKLYDICGYLCGHRLYNLFSLNRLRSAYTTTFKEYHKSNRLANGSDAIRLNLPAECTLFREHSQGLYYCKSDTFDFIKIIQAIWMQSLSTDVLIIFNSYDPVKRVHQVILNSSKVQEAFKKSCHTMQENFFDGIDLATDESSISYLFQFLVQGFIRVYAKDIYQLRLSNALLSKTGASGIRTNLLSLSAASEKKKDLRATAISAPCINNSNESSIALRCSCDKQYKNNSWFRRHLSSCAVHIHCTTITGCDPPAVNINTDAVILDNLIELEGIDELGDYTDHGNNGKISDLERESENDENEYYSNFCSHIIDNETD